MAKDRLTGTLAVILHADVAGSTGLVRQDEHVAHERIQETFHRFSDTITNYHGHVRELRGDALLAEFERASDAVSAALSFQVLHAEYIAQLNDDIQPMVRVGVALGEVIIADNTVTGEGVVLAQRIEQLAEPGGLCITGAIHEALPQRMPFSQENLGDQELKGFDEPVRVYQVSLSPGKSIPPAQEIRQPEWKPKSQRLIAVAAAITLVIAVGTAFWYEPWVTKEEPASIERMAFPLPDKPSIAVLPFANLSADTEQEYFSDGITEDIITNLSRFPDLFVIARNSTFTFKGRSATVKQVAEELGVHYVLNGSVQKAGNKVRITTQLVDTTTGHHLWAENYDRNLDDIFAVRDEVTQSIVATLMGAEYGKLQQAELRRLLRKDSKNLEAYEYVLRSIHVWLRFTKDANAEAGRLAEKAIELDPEYARASLMLAWVHLNEYRWKWGDDPERSLEQAYQMARKSIEMDDSDPWSHWAIGVVYLYRGDHEDAIAEYEKALARNPNDADVLAHMGLPLSFTGRSGLAVDQLKRAKRLNPAYPPWYPWIQGFAQVVAEQYEASVGPSKEAAARFPDIAEIRRNLAVAYHYMGRAEEAHAEVEESLRIDPEFTLDSVEEALPFSNPADLERFLLALREAGLPEHPLLPLPDKPSIAVLPFENFSDDKEQEYFVDGLTEDLITDLSRISGLLVIARNSSFVYKGQSVDVRDVSRELGVKYVLEGSVRRANDRIRVNTQLIDATTGSHIWAERYDSMIENVFDLQDDITSRIISVLEVKLTNTEQESSGQRYTKKLDAYDSLLKGLAVAGHRTKEANLEARNYFEKAVEIDTGFARAYSTLANTHRIAYRNGWSEFPERSLATAHDLVSKAIELEESSPQVNFVTALVYREKKEYKLAIAAAERAIALDPNYADALVALASILCYGGRAVEGLDLMERAIRLNPHHPSNYPFHVGQCYFVKASYDEAIDAFNRGNEQTPDSQRIHLWLAASHILVGNQDDAEWEADIVQTLNPGFSVDELHNLVPFKDPRHLETFLDALRKAGLPG